MMIDYWMNFFNKDSGITVLEFIIIAVLASILFTIVVFVFLRLFSLSKKLKSKLVKAYKYYKLLNKTIRTGDISVKIEKELLMKADKGTLTKRENRALESVLELRKERKKKLDKFLKKSLPHLPRLEDFNRGQDKRD
jgi:uncharacterized membrane protein YhiD involved in acid resistance